MMSLILVGSVASTLALLSSIARFSPNALRKVLGYEVWVDAIFGTGVTIMLALSGTITGAVMGAISGLVFGLCLWTAKGFMGYARYEKGENGKRSWVYHDAAWNMSTIISGCRSLFAKTKNFFSTFISKCKASNDESYVIAA